MIFIRVISRQHVLNMELKSWHERQSLRLPLVRFLTPDDVSQRIGSLQVGPYF